MGSWCACSHCSPPAQHLCVQPPHAANTHSGHSVCVYSHPTQQIHTVDTVSACTATTRNKYTQWTQCLCVQQPHAANTHSGHSVCVYSNYMQQIHTVDIVSVCTATTCSKYTVDTVLVCTATTRSKYTQQTQYLCTATTDSIASVCAATMQSLSHLKGRCANNLPMVVKAPKNIQLCLCVF